MKRPKNTLWVVALAALALAGATDLAVADSNRAASRLELALLGGLQTLNENDTAVPDMFVNVPLVASATYHLTPTWALEGEVTWMIPLEQRVDVGSGLDQDRKSPDVLAYQAGVRASLPLSSWTPYVAAGAGAVTFLSNSDADRLPRLDESQTAFALNFGAGATYDLASRWALRADLRELVAFPSNDATGLSSAGEADPIWMGRATLGLGYRF